MSRKVIEDVAEGRLGFVRLAAEAFSFLPPLGFQVVSQASTRGPSLESKRLSCSQTFLRRSRVGSQRNADATPELFAQSPQNE
jgi:hypothetical protein